MFYAVKNGRQTGIFNDWDTCKQHVSGFKGAVYKKCKTMDEAKEYLNTTVPTPPPKKRAVDDRVKDRSFAFHDDTLFVYTDGACKNNGMKDAEAGMGIYFGDERDVSEKIDGKQTNNTAEISAIIKTFEYIKDIEHVCIVSDSEYAINCATTYGHKLSTKKWKTDIPNKELVKTCYELYDTKRHILFMHVPAHTSGTDQHSIGNEMADTLANKAIGLTSCPYEKIYLLVPYKDKELAKSYKARWDPHKKLWYADVNSNKEKLLSRFQVRN